MIAGSYLSGVFLLLAVGCSKTNTTQAPTNGTLSIKVGNSNFTAAQVEHGLFLRIGFNLVAVFGLFYPKGPLTRQASTGIFAYLPPIGVTFSSRLKQRPGSPISSAVNAMMPIQSYGWAKS